MAVTFFAILGTVAAVFAEDAAPKRIAAIVTEYRQNSHADMIAGRLIQTLSLDGKGERPNLKLVSLYTDQVPKSDTSRELSKEFGFTIYDTIRGALTLGTDKLAVDGVVMVAEHGSYPRSETGQTVYPKRRFFEEISTVIRESGRGVPIFSDKHLADNWADAKWFYDTARELKCPLMAGSSVSTAWRVPEVDVPRGAKLRQIVALSYGAIDSYGFHGLEMMQCLAERRAGGETGVKSVQCLSGDAVWKAEAEGVFDRELLDLALARMEIRPISKGDAWKERVKEPVLFVIDYRDGLRACVFTLNGAVAQFASAWRTDEGKAEATLFRLQEVRPFMHFAWLVKGIDRLMHEGQAPWPVERTLLTSGLLDAAHVSKHENGKRLETPWLDVRYASQWNWKPPPHDQ